MIATIDTTYTIENDLTKKEKKQVAYTYLKQTN